MRALMVDAHVADVTNMNINGQNDKRMMHMVMMVSIIHVLLMHIMCMPVFDKVPHMARMARGNGEH